jgi:predicted nucleotidyltransferase
MAATKQRSQWLLHNYLLLERQLDRLVALAGRHDPNVLALVLFGSTARLTPHAASDADLLVLVQDEGAFDSSDLGPVRDRGVYLLVQAMNVPSEQACAWPLIPVVWNGDPMTLSPALLADIQRDGVLLSCRDTSALPPVLRSLLPYSAWKERVQAFLASDERVQHRV